MSRNIFIIILFLSFMISGFPQDMERESFVDQFDFISSGSVVTNYRGGNGDDGPPGHYNGDWSFKIMEKGLGGLTGTNVSYMNNYAAEASQGAGEIESPIIDVTSTTNQNPDRNWVIPAIPANTREGASSPQYALLIGDDGGYNALAFGQWDDKNYAVKVDVYLPDHTKSLINSNNDFVRIGLAVRIQPDVEDNTNQEVMIDGSTFITRQYGCYCLLYDTSEGKVYPTKILLQLPPPSSWDELRFLSLSNAGDADPSVAEFFGTPISVPEGWHTFGIKASGSEITFTADSTTLQVKDKTFSSGRAALLYRTSYLDGDNSSHDHGGKFDYLRVEPAPPPIVSWALY